MANTNERHINRRMIKKFCFIIVIKLNKLFYLQKKKQEDKRYCSCLIAGFTKLIRIMYHFAHK